MMVLQVHNIACSKAQEDEPWALKNGQTGGILKERCCTCWLHMERRKIRNRRPETPIGLVVAVVS